MADKLKEQLFQDSLLYCLEFCKLAKEQWCHSKWDELEEIDEGAADFMSNVLDDNLDFYSNEELFFYVDELDDALMQIGINIIVIPNE